MLPPTLLRSSARRALAFPLHRTYITGAPRMPQTPLDPVWYPAGTEATDPGQNGSYANPPPQKRQFRDPYAKWWDQQERKNFGEPIHEDNDILGRFSPEEYTWTTPGKGMVMMGCFVAAVGALCGVVYVTYPDKPGVPREFMFNGLEKELGGPKALAARKEQ